MKEKLYKYQELNCISKIFGYDCRDWLPNNSDLLNDIKYV